MLYVLTSLIDLGRLVSFLRVCQYLSHIIFSKASTEMTQTSHNCQMIRNSLASSSDEDCKTKINLSFASKFLRYIDVLSCCWLLAVTLGYLLSSPGLRFFRSFGSLAGKKDKTY